MRMILLTTLLLAGLAQAEEAPRSADEAEVAKLVKRAERAGFERYDVKGYLAAFDANAKWTFGRAEKADEHDYTLSYEQQAAVLAVRLKLPRTGSETLYFNDEKFDLADGKGTYSATIDRHFFGGSDGLRSVYTVEKQADGWRIMAVRSRPLRHMLGGEPRMYDEQGLSELDREVENTKSGAFIMRYTAMVNARRFHEAYALAKAAVEATPDDSESLAAASFVAFELGHVDEARELSKRARAIAPAIATPFPASEATPGRKPTDKAPAEKRPGAKKGR